MRLIDGDKLIMSLNDNYLANSPTGNETLEVHNYRESMCEGLEIAMATVEAAPTVSGWVSVKDRPPCNTQDVLVYAKGLLVKIGAYIVQSNEWWVFGLGGEYIVEYWMPLPEPPADMEVK